MLNTRQHASVVLSFALSPVMSSIVSSNVNLGPYYGVELVSTCFSFALWGATCLQTFMYFLNYPRDRRSIKSLVCWIWVMDTTHTMLLVTGLYSVLIHYFGNYVYGFFCYRIWIFSQKRWIIPTVWAPAALFQVVGIIVFIIFRSSHLNDREHFTVRSELTLTAVNGTAAVVDIALSFALIYLLWKSRIEGLEGSDHILQRVAIKSIHTGIWTAAFAACTVVTLAVLKNEQIYRGLYFPQCPLYCNSLLANLNTRARHAEQGPILSDLTTNRDSAVVTLRDIKVDRKRSASTMRTMSTVREDRTFPVIGPSGSAV
ncbi:hypothetical protein PLICRDRAFT_445933 [Plicaturopsis crispa FD-325 SS-3]|uniref:Unplaced genomic scaffold PLICRscaffold_22, whole genome shotgun sequence n=1 Tax=Plicaturopsis crispa FD-325 SS-3 TaxID=944288 RepID=A0A0C9SKF1_PLICR|nr:hypothetical protein PLICRDRAFT_445933 [Plicaturopsis crispa FD-325 SS-3]